MVEMNITKENSPKNGTHMIENQEPEEEEDLPREATERVIGVM
jgi:hypothetical protein